MNNGRGHACLRCWWTTTEYTHDASVLQQGLRTRNGCCIEESLDAWYLVWTPFALLLYTFCFNSLLWFSYKFTLTGICYLIFFIVVVLLGISFLILSKVVIGFSAVSELTGSLQLVAILGWGITYPTLGGYQFTFEQVSLFKGKKKKISWYLINNKKTLCFCFHVKVSNWVSDFPPTVDTV